jgi:hypothetical protein
MQTYLVRIFLQSMLHCPQQFRKLVPYTFVAIQMKLHLRKVSMQPEAKYIGCREEEEGEPFFIGLLQNNALIGQKNRRFENVQKKVLDFFCHTKEEGNLCSIRHQNFIHKHNLSQNITVRVTPEKMNSTPGLREMDRTTGVKVSVSIITFCQFEF